MRPTSSVTSPSSSTQLHRKPTKRVKRFALGSVAVLAIAGLAAGGAYAFQSAADSRASVAATTALTDSTGRQHEQLAAYDTVAEAHSDKSASVTLNEANQVLVDTQGKADASALTAVSSSLASFKTMPIDEVLSLTAQTKTETASLSAAAVEADRVAAEAAAAAEAARLAALATTNTPEGAKAAAQSLASSKYGWGADQFSCLNQLWQKESNWNYLAYNPSGATGIPQALPGSKMASAGTDWATNASTQVAWGLEYIKASSYGTPCAAWAHSQANNWY
ncbi:hypothetical protein [Cryobacterium roopkundense]|uniref:Excinuclease UvrABC nuclease subunit n=1 Tax=Cryobacterium roopkundense TaxID=1001240 RepID=A0A7W9E2C6_9MICO|nr:hypothetical protein [Cryobacterium roopkundense]MBB5639938.1 excinuclease UvrABC nuclease subunit [Cryobacterium roopkundense]